VTGHSNLRLALSGGISRDPLFFRVNDSRASYLMKSIAPRMKTALAGTALELYHGCVTKKGKILERCVYSAEDEPS